MKLTPYAKLLKMGKEKIEEVMAPIRSREMRKKAELEMCQLESRSMESEAKITELSSTYPIDFKKLIAATDERALIDRQIKQYGEIIEQMFPD